MRNAAIFGCALLLAAQAAPAAQDVYRWVDENGVVHYSDQPFPGAERVRIESAPAPGTRVPARPAPRPPVDAAPSGQQGAFSYESLTVTSPAAEETLWNIGATLNVTLDLQPALQPGHRVRVYFDGEPREVNGTRFTLDEVYRGVHNIQAEVLDQNGNVRIRSQPNRFYVQQTSVINRPGN